MNKRFEKDVENLSTFLLLVGAVGFGNAVVVAAALIWQNKFTLFLLIVCTMLFVVMLTMWLLARAGLKAKIKRSTGE